MVCRGGQEVGSKPGAKRFWSPISRLSLHCSLRQLEHVAVEVEHGRGEGESVRRRNGSGSSRMKLSRLGGSSDKAKAKVLVEQGLGEQQCRPTASQRKGGADFRTSWARSHGYGSQSQSGRHNNLMTVVPLRENVCAWITHWREAAGAAEGRFQ